VYFVSPGLLQLDVLQCRPIRNVTDVKLQSYRLTPIKISHKPSLKTSCIGGKSNWRELVGLI